MEKPARRKKGSIEKLLIKSHFKSSSKVSAQMLFERDICEYDSLKVKIFPHVNRISYVELHSYIKIRGHNIENGVLINVHNEEQLNLLIQALFYEPATSNQ